MTELDPKQDGGPARRNRTSQQRRLQFALDNAAGYRDGQEGGAEQETSPEPVRPMDEWRDLASQRIDDAMRQGMFDNLSGRGKPINLRRAPFLPADQQMAVTLLRNNGLAPEWIAGRKDTLAAIDNLRADLRNTVDAMRRELRPTTWAETSYGPLAPSGSVAGRPAWSRSTGASWFRTSSNPCATWRY